MPGNLPAELSSFIGREHLLTEVGRLLSTQQAEHAAYLNSHGDEAANSRLWAGIHFRGDIDAGLVLGKAVADRVAQRAE
jgi:hypothetical protein